MVHVVFDLSSNGECGGTCEEEYVSNVLEATVTTDGSMMVDGTSIAVFRVSSLRAVVHDYPDSLLHGDPRGVVAFGVGRPTVRVLWEFGGGTVTCSARQVVASWGAELKNGLQVARHGSARGSRAGRVVRHHAAGLPVPGEHDVGGRRATAREL